MRKRKSKNLEPRTERVSEFIIKEPTSKKGNWQSVFEKEAPIYMEMGCGKGKFIVEQAKNNPDKNFLAIEGQQSIVVMAMEKAQREELTNLKFITTYIFDMGEFFEDGEIEKLYLNFSDPWPKARHAKRRLTSRKYLAGYEKLLKGDKLVEFKTDNLPLFEFTLEELKECEYKILEMSYDLHNSEYESKNITTEYEEKFKNKGNKINYVKFSLKK